MFLVFFSGESAVFVFLEAVLFFQGCQASFLTFLRFAEHVSVRDMSTVLPF